MCEQLEIHFACDVSYIHFLVAAVHAPYYYFTNDEELLQLLHNGLQQITLRRNDMLLLSFCPDRENEFASAFVKSFSHNASLFYYLTPGSAEVYMLFLIN